MTGLCDEEREAHVCCLKPRLCRDDHYHQRDVEAIVAARVAAARADERERAARAVEAKREAFLDSPDLDHPAWVAGWHSAMDAATHAARSIRQGDA